MPKTFSTEESIARAVWAGQILSYSEEDSHDINSKASIDAFLDEEPGYRRIITNPRFENSPIPDCQQFLDPIAQLFFLPFGSNAKAYASQTTYSQRLALGLFKKVISRWGTPETKIGEYAEKTVPRAYQCVQSPDVYELLRCSYQHNAEEIWDKMNYLARPMDDGRVLWQISRRLPKFKRIRIHLLVDTEKRTRLRPQFCVDTKTALYGLGLDPAPDGWQQRHILEEHCQTPRSLHAEMQLVIHLYADPARDQRLAYFGCSKLACHQCYKFLHALGQPIFA
ncbi:hypothetical protein B0H63DRAFT_551303 [Podospora didyma]|uniref:Uncharacterized protein n=1 Tax=Podospora didyma TaxID=330526 RepID=A0AAE0KAM5_9PEZI|nr:hypothetical protein B0H63DRAFT_551303 [Podospora didyma]